MTQQRYVWSTFTFWTITQNLSLVSSSPTTQLVFQTPTASSPTLSALLCTSQPARKWALSSSLKWSASRAKSASDVPRLPAVSERAESWTWRIQAIPMRLNQVSRSMILMSMMESQPSWRGVGVWRQQGRSLASILTLRWFWKTTCRVSGSAVSFHQLGHD